MKWLRHNDVWKDYYTGKPVKVAPLQGGPRADQIPLEVAAEGYKEYAAQFGTSQSLERLCERGGFGSTELAILLYERIKRLEQPAQETSGEYRPPAHFVCICKERLALMANPDCPIHGDGTTSNRGSDHA